MRKTNVPTPKQLAVMQGASEGKTLDAIARELNITFSTVSTRKRRTFAKLGATNLTHAVAICVIRGYIPGPLVCDGHE